MTNGSNPTVHTDYLGMFVRESTGGSTSSLKYIITPEGRIKNTGTDAAPVWSWEYNLTDHLGNVRVVLRPHANPGYAYVDQQLNYFPFGMLMSETSSFSLTDNRYLYNGKELQTDFGLNWYDYGARFYDPAIGRWHSVDPLAEFHFNATPYNYCFNNPMRFIDPMGMDTLRTDQNGDPHVDLDQVDIHGDKKPSWIKRMFKNFLNAFEPGTDTYEKPYGEPWTMTDGQGNDNSKAKVDGPGGNIDDLNELVGYDWLGKFAFFSKLNAIDDKLKSMKNEKVEKPGNTSDKKILEDHGGTQKTKTDNSGRPIKIDKFKNNNRGDSTDVKHYIGNYREGENPPDSIMLRIKKGDEGGRDVTNKYW